jgi:aryl-alcohol dehydrogenase-like predicted oxidoreductase
VALPETQLPCGDTTSRIVLGGRFGEEPERDTHHRLDRFLDWGGRLVDTAHSYAAGESERVIGRWMSRRGRGRIGVIDKICHLRDGRADARPETIRAELDESLRRLGTDHIDVVMLHRDDPAVPVDDIVAALAAELQRGRARRIGVSNWPYPRLRRFLDLTTTAGLSPVVSYQRSLAIPKTQIWPGAMSITDSWATRLAQHQIPLLAWAAQARGWFAQSPPDNTELAAGPFATARNRRLYDLAVEIGSRHRCPATTIALAWLLRQDHVWPIVGPATDTELTESMHATQVELSGAEIAALDDARQPDPAR